MHMTLLGVLVALSPRVLYAHGGGAEALADQALGGVIMIAGGAAYLAGGLFLVQLLLRARAVRPAAGEEV